MVVGELDIRKDRIFQVLFETASEGLVVSDRTGLIRLCNPRICEMFGYTKEELVGQPIELLLPLDLRKIHEQHRDHYFKDPVRRTMGIGLDLEAQRKNGQCFPIEVSLNHFKSDGELYVMALLTDITQRKSAEQQLSELNKALEQKVEQRTKELQNSQQLYREIARNFPNGTINVFDHDLNYVFAEGSDLYRFGVTSDQLVGTSYIKSLPQQVASDIEIKLQEAFQGKNQTFEVLLKRGAYQLNVVGLKDDQGEIQQILVVEQNITKQKEAEQNMAKALERERELSDLKSRFVSMASHEFRTPLSTILSSTNLATKYVDGQHIENTHKHLKRIKTSVQNLTGILNDFLSLSKLEEGKTTLQIEPIVVRDFMTDLVEEMQELSKDGQIIETQFKLGITDMLMDRALLKNMGMNLISNAIKYSEEHKPILVDIKTHQDQFIMTVKDQGIGIPEREQKHLFERFFRATNVSNIQGTGLGLNIVKKYLDLLHGDIKIESTFGQGTVVTITFPISSKTL